MGHAVQDKLEHSGTLMSDGFDANNRTMEASSRDSTLRQLSKQMPQNPHTEYNKPWYQESQKKDYLKDRNDVTISFDDEEELPSQV